MTAQKGKVVKIMTFGYETDTICIACVQTSFELGSNERSTATGFMNNLFHFSTTGSFKNKNFPVLMLIL